MIASLEGNWTDQLAHEKLDVVVCAMEDLARREKERKEKRGDEGKDHREENHEKEQGKRKR